MPKFLVEFEKPMSMAEFPEIQGIEGTCQVDRLSDRTFMLTAKGQPEISGAIVSELS